MFDVRAFLEDTNIPVYTEGKNTQRGWINICCPFDCGDSSNHGGFNLYTGHYSCWNCGHHWTDQVVSKLANVSIHEARDIINKYESYAGLREEKPEEKKKKISKLKFPFGCGELDKVHRKYLKGRGYDPDELVKDWDIMGTKNLGDYSNRIIAPVYLDGVPVSYVGRDITGKHPFRYKTCEKKDEVIFHKTIIYGLDQVKHRRAVIVEGVFDAWRIGKGACATFGDAWTKAQANFITENLDEVFILYDKGAERQAEELYYALIGIMKCVEVIHLIHSDDPGTMAEREVYVLRSNFLKY